MRPYGWSYDSKWIINADLFTRYLVVWREGLRHYLLRWSWPIGPPNADVPTRNRQLIRYETHDVPAFVSESFMPPEDAMKYLIEFIYEDRS